MYSSLPTPEEVAAYEPVELLELCLKLHQSAERDTAPAVAAAAAAAAAMTLRPQESVRFRYPPITKTINGKFTFRVIEGEITDSEIIVVLGIPGTAKSNFLHMVAPTLKPVESSNWETPNEIPKLAFKHRKHFLNKKPIALTVRDLLNQKIPDSCMKFSFVYYVIEPLQINLLMDKLVNDLSPGQLQILALCICLGKPADIYLIDIPSAYLDIPQCIAISRVIKWFMRHEKKAAFVVENNFRVASYLADRIIVVEGQPCIDCTASAPGSLLAGADLYLSQLVEYQRIPGA